MPTSVRRIIALVLVACLVAEPVLSAVIPEGPYRGSINDSVYCGSRLTHCRDDEKRSNLQYFNSQALTAVPRGFRDLLRRLPHWSQLPGGVYQSASLATADVREAAVAYTTEFQYHPMGKGEAVSYDVSEETWPIIFSLIDEALGESDNTDHKERMDERIRRRCRVPKGGSQKASDMKPNKTGFQNHESTQCEY